MKGNNKECAVTVRAGELSLHDLQGYVVRLASVCDHAMLQDGMGFSKATASLGHLLSSLDCSEWDSSMEKAATFIIQVHAKQLNITFATPKQGSLTQHVKAVVNPFIYETKDRVHFWTPLNNSYLAIVLKSLSECYSEVSTETVETGQEITVAKKDIHLILAELAVIFDLNAGTKGLITSVDGKEKIISHLDLSSPLESVPYKQSKLSLMLPQGRAKAVITIKNNTQAESEIQSTIGFTALKRNDANHTSYAFYIGSEKSEFLNNLAATNSLTVVEDDAYSTEFQAIKKMEEEREKRLLESRKLSFEPSTKKLTIQFPYDMDIVNFVRKFASRSYDGLSHKHTVAFNALNSVGNGALVKDLLKNYGFNMDKGSLFAFNEFLSNIKPNELSGKTKYLIVEDDTLYARFDFNYTSLNEIKDLPEKSRRYRSPDLGWAIAVTGGVFEVIKNLEEKGWYSHSSLSVIQDKVAELQSNEEKEVESQKVRLSIANEASVSAKSDVRAVLNGQLFEYQYVPIEYSKYTQSFILADTMGLGKTIEALGVLEYHSPEQTLIVAPNIATPNWEAEIRRFLNVSEADVYRIKKVKDIDADAIRAAKYIVVHYDILYKCRNHIIKYARLDGIVLDESHKVKHEKTKVSQTALLIKEHFNPKIKLLLSGTALTGRAFHLINQLKFLDVLDSHFGGFYSFTARFCGGKHNDFGYEYKKESTNKEELNALLKQVCMVRRTRDIPELSSQLPQKRRFRHDVEMSPAFAKKYKAVEKNVAVAMMDKYKKKAESMWDKKRYVAIKGVTKAAQRQSFVHGYINKQVAALTDAEALALTVVLQGVVAESKIKPAIEFCSEYLERSEEDSSPALVVFCYRRVVLDALLNHFKSEGGVRVGRITAGMSADERIEAQNRYENGEFDLLICAIKAANTNISLPSGNTSLMVDLFDQPDAYLQAEDRQLRATSRGDYVDVNYMVAGGTVDDDVWERHVDKVNAITNILDGDVGHEFEVKREDAKILSSLKDNIYSLLGG